MLRRNELLDLYIDLATSIDALEERIEKLEKSIPKAQAKDSPAPKKTGKRGRPRKNQ